MPGVFEISVRADTKDLVRKLGALADKQIPYATTLALNATGMAVRDAERANIKKTFPTATPFTVNSVVLLKARKGNPTVTILVKDIAASYLQPYEDGGVHKLNSRALLNPKNVTLNQYGNLAKGKLASLRARPDVFIGPVKTKAGTISGVWQRVKATKGKPASLKLLIRFGDALPVKQSLGYKTVGKTIISARYRIEFNKAMALALATAR